MRALAQEAEAAAEAQRKAEIARAKAAKQSGDLDQSGPEGRAPCETCDLHTVAQGSRRAGSKKGAKIHARNLQ